MKMEDRIYSSSFFYPLYNGQVRELNDLERIKGPIRVRSNVYLKREMWEAMCARTWEEYMQSLEEYDECLATDPSSIPDIGLSYQLKDGRTIDIVTDNSLGKYEWVVEFTIADQEAPTIIQLSPIKQDTQELDFSIDNSTEVVLG